MRLFVLASGALALACFAAPSNTVRAHQPKTLHGQGCVEAGVENRCLIVKDLTTGTLYNVLTKEPRPDIGEGIDFTGTLHDGPSTCMQGISVDVTSWMRKSSIKCSHHQEPAK
jgi:hypothetical protein